MTKNHATQEITAPGKILTSTGWKNMQTTKPNNKIIAANERAARILNIHTP